jgi:hypothetical protein
LGKNNTYLLPLLWQKSLDKHSKAICCWCGCDLVLVPRPQPKLRYRLPDNAATVDHILPRSRGGKSSIISARKNGDMRKSPLRGDYANVKLCCYRCNNLRDQADNCIGALHCAYAVVGKHKQKITAWLNKLPNSAKTNQGGFIEEA